VTEKEKLYLVKQYVGLVPKVEKLKQSTSSETKKIADRLAEIIGNSIKVLSKPTC
jgi:hypothetical protein